MTKKLLILWVLIAPLLAPPAWTENPGEAGGQVLKLPTQSRPTGTGEAFAAIADDASAIYWNPAGLARIKQNEISLTYMNRLLNIRQYNLSWARPFKNTGGRSSVLGVGLFGLYATDTRRDETTGNELGEFVDSNTYLSVAYGRALSSRLSFGLGLKFLSNRLDAYKSSNIAFDLAGLSLLTQEISFGLNLQNIGTGIKFSGEMEKVPLNLKAGTAWRPSGKNWSLALDLNAPWDAPPSVHAGGEYGFAKGLSVRAGYKHKTQKVHLGGLYGFSAGWGLTLKNCRLDYAFTPYGDLGNDAHRLTLGAIF